MSDDLVKRLRDMDGVWVSDEAIAAADRIEELEAKLHKALAFLDDLWVSGDYFAGELNDLRRELKGQDNE